MKILFGLLIVSVSASILALGAMWWRLRRQLRRSDHVLKDAKTEPISGAQPEHVEQHR